MCAHALKSSDLLLLHLLLQEAFSSFALVLAIIITSLHFAMRLGNITSPLTWHEPGSSLACFLLLNLSGTEEKYLVLSESFQRGRSQQKNSHNANIVSELSETCDDSVWLNGSQKKKAWTWIPWFYFNFNFLSSLLLSLIGMEERF